MLFALLFIIPSYLINFIYEKLINVIGHRRLDILYMSMIILTTTLIVMLFFAFKFILNKANLNNLDELVNISKVKDKIVDTVKSKTKKMKEEVSKAAEKATEKPEEKSPEKLPEKSPEKSNEKTE